MVHACADLHGGEVYAYIYIRTYIYISTFPLFVCICTCITFRSVHKVKTRFRREATFTYCSVRRDRAVG